MIRNLAQTAFIDPACEGIAAFEITPSMGRKRVFVVAMRGAVQHGFAPPDPFEWMPLAMGLTDEPLPVTPDAWAAQPYALPARSARVSSTAGDEFVAVPVRGEVVRDAAGRLFEAAGQRLRPLERLVRSPQGDLYELLPAPPAASASRDVFDSDVVEEPEQELVEDQAQASRVAVAASAQTAPPSIPACRKIFADPGLPRVVRLGDFKAMLAPQLAQRERLRDAHRLPCHVQVFESTREQRVDVLFEAIQSEARCAAPIQPLTETAVAQLGLGGFLARRPRPPRALRREPGTVLPFDRFFRLTLSADPTAEMRAPSAAASSAGQPQAEAPSSAAAAAPPAPAPEHPGKREIPERFQKPWEFQFSRDEVLYDIHVGGSGGLLASLASKLRRWLGGREEFRKWQALLCGKGFEEQLWVVRPPRRSLSDPRVREWAQRALEAAGYDARVMLLEWEVFWRRKGV